MTWRLAAAAATLWCAPAFANPPLPPGGMEAEPTKAPEAVGDVSWVQLVSGEWLQGKFRRVRADAVVFESNQLGRLNLDFDNVIVLWVPEKDRWVLSDFTDRLGPGVVWNNKVYINDAVQGEIALDRSQLLGVVKGGRAELQNWTLSVVLGADGSVGNAKQLNLSGSVRPTRETTRSRFTVGYQGTYGLVGAGSPSVVSETKNNHFGDSTFDIFLTPIFYLTPYTVDAYYDPFQNLDLRLNVAAGFGARYEPINPLEFGGGLFGVYQRVNYKSVAVGTDDFFNGYGMRASAYLKWNVNATDVFQVSWLSNVMFNDFGRTNHRGDISFSQKITTIISWNVQGIFQRTEDPPDILNADGSTTVVVPNDAQFIFGFSLNL